jgi:hypothetical protein
VWYVLQNRPGAWSDVDRWLVQHSEPVYKVTKFGVPLVWIFPFAELEKNHARPATGSSD